MGTVFGLDLAATRKSGYCILRNGKSVEFGMLGTDDEMLRKIREFKPRVVAIDSPLSLPKKGTMRGIERKMIARGLRVFPLFPSMKKLARRAISLKRKIAGMGIETIEVHPRSTAKVLGIRPEDCPREMNPHERDALLAALTAELFLKRRCEKVGKGKGLMLPLPRRRHILL